MEKLYNNILLKDNFADEPCDFNNVPYLVNPPEVIDVSVGRQLFVDDFLIQETDLTPEYHKAEKFAENPVLFPEKPWEKEGSPGTCPKSGGIWYDEQEGIFKAWYEACWCRNMCYAISKDGIHWDRPELDLVPGTNIILPYEHAQTDDILPFSNDPGYLRPDSTTVFIDYDAPREERYKLFLRTPGWEYPGTVGVSEDGIHFRDLGFVGILGDRSTVFYNPFRKKWVYSVRSQFWNGEFERSRIYYECDRFMDGKQWDVSKERYWMKVDEKDKPLPDIGEKPHLYNVDCVGYESIMLGMFQILYGPVNDQCAQTGIPKVTELIPMYSRDGYHFTRPCRKSLIPCSRTAGSWDRGYVQSVGGVTVINGDELWIYYIGFAGDENKKTEKETMESGMYSNSATGIAKLRRDGFVSMNGSGSLLTRKLTFTGKTAMFVNVHGSVQAQLLDENGAVLDTSNTFTGDSTKAELVFSKVNIRDMNDKVLRIRFNVDGKLYSFGFADEQGDFGGAHAAGMVK